MAEERETQWVWRLAEPLSQWLMLLCPSRWAWILQDALGIAFCLYMLKTIRLPTFKVRAMGAGPGRPEA